MGFSHFFLGGVLDSISNVAKLFFCRVGTYRSTSRTAVETYSWDEAKQRIDVHYRPDGLVLAAGSLPVDLTAVKDGSCFIFK